MSRIGDTISRQAAIDALCAVCGKACDKSKFVYNAPQYEQVILCPEHYCLCTLPSAQPEIIRCKDCKYWVLGYITDNDDFIPPKCGEWQQMVGHSSDDYCSLAVRREVTE